VNSAGSDVLLQGYLAHKKTPTHPWDPARTLGIGLRQGPRGVRFLISEVPLYRPSKSTYSRTFAPGDFGKGPGAKTKCPITGVPRP